MWQEGLVSGLKGPKPEKSMDRWINPAKSNSMLLFLFHFHYFICDPSDFYYLCPLFCTSFIHFPSSSSYSDFLSIPPAAPLPSPPLFLSPSQPPTFLHPPQPALTPSSICSTDSWFPRGLRGDRDHGALWNLYAQISCWIREWRRSAVALQGRGDEQGGGKIRR